LGLIQSASGRQYGYSHRIDFWDSFRSALCLLLGYRSSYF